MGRGPNAATYDRIETIKVERMAGKTYATIGAILGITPSAVHQLAVQYLSKEVCRPRKQQAQPEGVQHGVNTTQRQYRLQEWQAVMDHYPRCRYCDQDATEAAHIVANTKANLAQYGFRAVNNRANLVPTCCAHNSRAMQEARGQVEKDAHMEAIKESFNKDGET